MSGTVSPAPERAASEQSNWRITIAVPTYRRASMLPRLLDRLVAECRNLPNVDVIVADNACEQQVEDLVVATRRDTGARLRYVAVREPGLAHVRNAALLNSDADYVAFVDDDVVPQPGWLNGVRAVLSEGERLQFCGGPIDPVDARLDPIELDPESECVCGAQRYPEERFEMDVMSERMVIGGNFVVDRALACRVGGFHPAFQRRGDNIGSLEDHEFFMRFTGAGARGCYDRRMGVLTIVPPDRLDFSYAIRWKSGNGFYGALLDYLLAATGDPRSPAPSTLRTLAPLWAIRELAASQLQSGPMTRLRRAYLLGYLRGTARLLRDRATRAALLAPAPLWQKTPSARDAM